MAFVHVSFFFARAIFSVYPDQEQNDGSLNHCNPPPPFSSSACRRGLEVQSTCLSSRSKRSRVTDREVGAAFEAPAELSVLVEVE